VNVARDDEPLATVLSAELDALSQKFESSNEPMNIDGMFARYVVSGVGSTVRRWNSDLCANSWERQLHDSHFAFPSVAALGYQVYRDPSAEIATLFCNAVAILRQRDVYPEDRLSFVFFPTALVGIALGSVAAGPNEEILEWLNLTVRNRPAVDRSAFADTVDLWAQAVISREPRRVAAVEHPRDLLESAAIVVGQRKGLLESDVSGASANAGAAILSDLLATRVEVDAKEAAVLWAAATYVVSSSISELVLSKDKISSLLRTFPSAMRRWRWDPDTLKDPVRWVIREEREIQDILWLMLRPIVDDLVDEEPLQKVGHASTRSDFGIPSMRLLIEVKYARRASDFKTIEGEIVVDSFRYLSSHRHIYDRILVFIYDASSSVQEHEITRSALLRDERITDVVIVSRPSQLPPP
jgi:hypothetical protein